MAKMRIAPEDRLRVKLECLRLLLTLKLNRAKSKLIWGFVESYLRLGAEDQAEFQREFGTLPESEQEAVMDYVKYWPDEMEEKGLKRAIRRQFRRRFGEAVADRLVGQLGPADGPVLEDLTEALLDFATPVDAEAWIVRNVPQEDKGGD